MTSARRRPRRGKNRNLFAARDQSLLDLVDNVLSKGVVVSGELMLGLADVDLVYLRLTALLCAADRVSPAARAWRGRRVVLPPGGRS
jgi:gas vesicle protein GvpA/GvpJ/GvpM family